MNAPARLTIDIWSDVMCPWCIIGYKQLETALARLEGEVEAEVRWHPYELNRDMPPEGEDMERHMMRKYGIAPSEMAGPGDRMTAIAERAGYSMAWSGEGDPPEKRLWNTFLAHRLLRWALEAGGAEAQTRLKLALFDAHFQQRRNVSDPEVLVGIAEAAGLDGEAARAALGDEALAEQVRAEEAEAMEMGITAVPMILVNRKFMIPGAQEPDTYESMLRRVVAQSRTRA